MLYFFIGSNWNTINRKYYWSKANARGFYNFFLDIFNDNGNGKSTLGNFHFDPRIKNNEYFEVGTHNLPKTQTCKTITQTVKYQQGQERSDDTSDGISHDTDDTASDDTSENTMDPYKITADSSTISPRIATSSVEDTSGANEEVEMTGSLTIIDTPGLNETSGNDLEHD